MKNIVTMNKLMKYRENVTKVLDNILKQRSAQQFLRKIRILNKKYDRCNKKTTHSCDVLLPQQHHHVITNVIISSNNYHRAKIINLSASLLFVLRRDFVT